MSLLRRRNVDEATAAAVAAELGAGAAKVTVFDSRCEDSLDEVLSGATLVVDIACDGFPGPVAAGRRALVLRIATTAAARLDVAESVAAALLARWPSAAGRRGDIHTALQEAIGNAVMHGNLALDGTMRRLRESLPVFGATMAERLADPVYGRRPITITAEWAKRRLRVSVEDVGSGFDPAFRPLDCRCPQGNGIADILGRCQEVTFSAGGRCISMVFAAPSPT